VLTVGAYSTVIDSKILTDDVGFPRFGGRFSYAA
jgi:hypothetical protein